MGFFDGGFGGLVSGALGAIGGLVGGGFDAAHDRDLARMNQNFQEKVYQNQLQWKAADAKKAGLHPLAALGGGSYSAGNIASSGGTNYAGALGKLGEGIGDAFAAYMNKDEIQEQKDRARRKDDLDSKLKNAQIESVLAQTKESLARAQSYTRPFATGREFISGQTDSGDSAIPSRSTNPSIIVRPVPGVTGSSFDYSRYRKPHDINMSSDYQQELGDEFGQVYNMARKATRENKKYWRDPGTGIEYEFDRRTGYWYEVYTGGGGGV